MSKVSDGILQNIQDSVDYTNDDKSKAKERIIFNDPLQSEQEYEACLKQVEKIFFAKPNTPKGDELDKLCKLVHDYEEIHCKIET